MFASGTSTVVVFALALLATTFGARTNGYAHRGASSTMLPECAACGRFVRPGPSLRGGRLRLWTGAVSLVPTEPFQPSTTPANARAGAIAHRGKRWWPPGRRFRTGNAWPARRGIFRAVPMPRCVLPGPFAPRGVLFRAQDPSSTIKAVLLALREHRPSGPIEAAALPPTNVRREVGW